MNYQYRYNEDGHKVVEVYPPKVDKAEFGMPRWQAILIAIIFGVVFGVLYYQAY